MKTRNTLQILSLPLLKLILLTLTLLPFGAVTYNDEETEPRILQSSNTCTNTPPPQSSSSKAVIDRVLKYLDDNQSTLKSNVFQSYNKFLNSTKPSNGYTFEDFRQNLEWMARTGVPNPNNPTSPYKFYLGPDNCNNDGWQLGLVNVAAFLSQAMALGIRNDTCDELNWESNDDGLYPLSNACGMRGWDYASNYHSCDEKYNCKVRGSMMMKAVDKSRGSRTPPHLECYPRSEGRTYTGYFDPEKGVLEDRIVASTLGRTDVEGCCWWGRGALQTKGTCQLGKINYFLGKGADNNGMKNRYQDVDFCKNPEAICSDERTMEMRWVVALFEWTERVQSYDTNGWNYIEQLNRATQGDLLNDLRFEKSSFIDEVGGILEQGCPYPPCDTVERIQRLNWANARKSSFRVALESLGLPMKSKAFREIESILWRSKDNFEEVVLRSINPTDKKTYQSYRYQFSDFMDALRLMSDVGYDNKYFYIGQTRNGEVDPVSGLANIALFLSQAVVQSIQDDACDEHNIHKFSGKFPVSNSCGQFGLSYQNISCTGKKNDMTCPLDLKQSSSGVTRSLDLRAPQPFKCAPKSQFPVTGFWDARRIEEDHRTAFANEFGRTDIEGCCWWGRGVFRNVTRGRCVFGQMNYYIGKRAADEGRASLYPTIDFCQFPEAICASEFSHQLRWVSGMFHWVQEVQTFQSRGWSYMDELREITLNETMTGNINRTLSAQVDCILTTGKVDCDAAHDRTDLLGEILSAISSFGLPTMSPTVTPPTDPPVPLPTTSPVIPPSPYPTSSQQPTSSPVIFENPSKASIEYIMSFLRDKEALIKSKILVSVSGEQSIYTFESFISNLELMAKGIRDGKFFFVGKGSSSKTRQRAIVNIAAFLAHVRTLSIESNTCDEPNTETIEPTRYPLSNACGQYGLSYQDMRCDEEEAFMECKPDPSMQMTGISRETAQPKPPPFFCGPRQFFPFTGYYDSIDDRVKNDSPSSNVFGRQNVESCCWWGRGSARATGVCLYGKLNYYLGEYFSGVDFCENPGSICSGSFSYSLMWITGMFIWVEYMQSNALYSDALDQFVNGEIDENALIDIVSDTLDYGRNKGHRQTNFQLTLMLLS